ncbi:MAG: FMN-binding negative transcriptional regulator [Pseudomonadota bacterium]
MRTVSVMTAAFERPANAGVVKRVEWKERQVMYVPKAYRADHPRKIAQAYPFATLATFGEQLFATATPLYFIGDVDTSDIMAGHFAAGNPQAKSLTDGMDALAVFQGPHAYISAHWYEDRPTVPTWDYIAAHVRGTIEVLRTDPGKLDVLERVSADSEAYQENPWTLADAPPGRVAQLLGGITAFHLHITEIIGVTKLNQTHPRTDQLRVAEQLEQRNFFGDQEISQAIRALKSDHV